MSDAQIFQFPGYDNADSLRPVNEWVSIQSLSDRTIEAATYIISRQVEGGPVIVGRNVLHISNDAGESADGAIEIMLGVIAVQKPQLKLRGNFRSIMGDELYEAVSVASPQLERRLVFIGASTVDEVTLASAALISRTDQILENVGAIIRLS